MNKLNFQWLRKHPVKTILATSLTVFVALKIVHILPLVNLKDKYLEDFRANGYSLWPIATEFFRIDPRNLSIIKASNDTIIIQDTTSGAVFTLTCPSWENDFCLLRNGDAIYIPFSGTFIGGWESISQESSGRFLWRAINLEDHSPDYLRSI